MIKVFIQNEAGSNQKNLHNEKTLEYKGAMTISRPYPFPYGFILNTTGPDGDNLDCYVLTTRPLLSGTIVECEVMGLLEQIEDGEEDHKVIAILPGEPVQFDAEMMVIFQEFITHNVLDRVSVGRFLGKEAAEVHIHGRTDR